MLNDYFDASLKKSKLLSIIYDYNYLIVYNVYPINSSTCIIFLVNYSYKKRINNKVKKPYQMNKEYVYLNIESK